MAWHLHVDARRTEGLQPRRTASHFPIASYRTLDRARTVYKSWGALRRDERAFAWSEDRVARRQLADPMADTAPNRPLDHLRRWDRGLASDERRWIGASSMNDLHRPYCSPTGYMPSLPAGLASYRAPTEGQASLAAARFTGANFGTSDARRQAFRRATPFYKDRFGALLNPERDA